MKTAIIGGIGSGKSTATKIIEDLGYKTLNCDEVYKTVSNSLNYIKLIDENFPGVVYNNTIDRKKLGSMVFYDLNKLELLNSIAHPLVKKQLDLLCKDLNDVFIEVPVFIGSGLENDFFDKVILISATEETKIKRILKRDNCSVEYAKRVIANQPSDDELKKYASIVLSNDKDVEQLKTEILTILQ